MYHIITHPVLLNYGGILQAYALQRVVQSHGKPCSNIHYNPRFSFNNPRVRGIRSALKYWKPFIKKLVRPGDEILNYHHYPFIHSLFRRHFMKYWVLDDERSLLHTLPQEDSFIVGSDQVWRASHARVLESVSHFFLGFTNPEQRSRSFAYAASFGTDTWEGTPEEAAECARLLKDFKAVSVREHSGIRLCREVFGVDAVQMPDPTLLLEPEDYLHICRHSWARRKKASFIAAYLLDETPQAIQLLNDSAKSLGLSIQHLKEHANAHRTADRLPLSIPQWLRYIADSQCVLTDSFHGCVFAIIFNKPFVCLGNELRGSTRFESLLNTFGLQERLVTSHNVNHMLHIMKPPIEWERVNQIRQSEKVRAINFIKKNIA